MVGRRGRAEEGGDGFLEGVGLEREAGVGFGLEVLGESREWVGGERGADDGRDMTASIW